MLKMEVEMEKSINEQFKIITKGVEKVVNDEELNSGKKPMEIKLELAETITALYHTEIETEKALEYYNDAFKVKGIPKDIPTLLIDIDKDMLSDNIALLKDKGFVQSNSEFRRLLKQGGIQLNGSKIDDPEYVLICGDVLKIGKKKFVKIIK